MYQVPGTMNLPAAGRPSSEIELNRNLSQGLLGTLYLVHGT